MGFTLVENNLLFEFGDRWTTVMKWDRQQAHIEGMANDELGHVHEGKDVDFVGLLEGKVLFFIEVKDHRHTPGHDNSSLGQKFEMKVRSTVAALVGGYRNGSSECKSLFDALADPRRTIRLVIWEEKPFESIRSESILDKRRKARGAIDTRRAQRDVHWLHVDTIWVSSFDHHDMVPDLCVTHLPKDRKEKVDRLLEIFRKYPGKEAKWAIMDTLDVPTLERWLERAPSVSTPWQLLRRS